MRGLALVLALFPGFAIAEPVIERFSGLLPLNTPDAPETAALVTFLRDHEGRVVILDVTIDTSVSIQGQIDAMAACGLPEDVTAADLLNHPLGLPSVTSGQVTCLNSITFESGRQALPMNAMSTGIVSWNAEGFFLVRGTQLGGQNPPSYWLREIEADAATWAAEVNR